MKTIISLLFILSLSFATHAAGEVDPAFNPGLMTENINYPYTTVRRFAVQSDGKVLIGGYFNAVGKVPSASLA